MSGQKRWTIWNPMTMQTRTVDEDGIKKFTDDWPTVIGVENKYVYGITVTRIK